MRKLLWLLLIPLSAQANLRMFVSSDEHAVYDRAILYLKATEALRVEYLKTHPEGKVLHLFNGDISGTQKSTTFDQGWGLYTFLSKLGKLRPLAVNVGNHEGHDFSPETPEDRNRLFVEQTRWLIRSLMGSLFNPQFQLISANVITHEGYRDLFKSYQDYRTSEDRVLRVVGLALETLREESSYSDSGNFVWLDRIESYRETLRKQAILASEQGVDALVIMVHDGMAMAQELVEDFHQWRNSWPMRMGFPNLQKLKIPLVVAGHQHQVLRVKVQETEIVEAGAFFDFAMADFDSELNLVSLEQWGKEMQEGFHTTLRVHEPLIQDAVESLEKEIQRSETHFSEVLGTTQDFSRDMKKMTSETTDFGTRIAEAFRNWAIDALKKEDLLSSEVFSWINSTSFRSQPEIQSGNFTRGQLYELVPYPGQVKIFLMEGQNIQKLFQNLRDFGMNRSRPLLTPLTSSNLSSDLLFQGKPLEPKKKYLLVLDPWLAVNGFKIEGVNAILESSEKLSITQDQQKILEEYLPPILSLAPQDCAQAFLSR